MNKECFPIDNLREDIETEAKLAAGKDGSREGR